MSDRWEWVPIKPTEGLAQVVPIPASAEVDVTRWPSGREGVYLATVGDSMEVIHEQRDGVCVGCEQFGEPVEWLLAEARGHSDERDT